MLRAAAPNRPSANPFRTEEANSEVRVGCMFMAQTACASERPLTIRQIAEPGVIRMRHRWIVRAGHVPLVQKDEAVMVRTAEWLSSSTRRIIDKCHPLKTSPAVR